MRNQLAKKVIKQVGGKGSLQMTTNESFLHNKNRQTEKCTVQSFVLCSIDPESCSQLLKVFKLTL